MIHRKALVAGVFLAAAGAVMLAGQGSDAAREAIASALGLWPLAVIAIGVGLLLRHTRLNLAGAALAAAVPGLLLGGVVVAAPDVDLRGGCDEPRPTTTSRQSGAFEGPGTVDLDLSCGELGVTTAPGTAWDVAHRDVAEGRAAITATGDRLAVRSGNGEDSWDFGRGGDRWQVTLPTSVPLDLDATVNAGRARLDLEGARLGELDLGVNAGVLRADLTGATVVRLDLEVNAGAATVLLPARADLTGDVSVAAGSIEICAPADLGIRISGEAVFGSTTFNGLVRAGDAWETPGYSTATYQAELGVAASAGSVVLNPQGGCK